MPSDQSQDKLSAIHETDVQFSDSEFDASGDCSSDEEYSDTNAQTASNSLKRACVYTDGEIIDSAIGHWRRYISECRNALTFLRKKLVSDYIEHILRTPSTQRPLHGSSRLSPTSQFHGMDSFRKRSSSNGSVHGKRQRAMKRILRHSVKIANQRHLACVSTFACVSSQLTKWRNPKTANHPQRCQFRDPTLTTWEQPCSNVCLPLVPVCSTHLVKLDASSLEQLNDSGRQMFTSTTIDENDARDVGSSSNLVQTARRSETDPKSKSQIDNLAPTHSANNEDVTISQYLFRTCGGVPGRVCNEPTVAWDLSSKCPRHFIVASTDTER